MIGFTRTKKDLLVIIGLKQTNKTVILFPKEYTPLKYWYVYINQVTSYQLS